MIHGPNRWARKRSSVAQTNSVQRGDELHDIYASAVAWLYGRCGFLIRFFLTSHLVARLAGWIQDSSLSRRWIESFIQKNRISLDDVAIPPKGFRSFNDFFTRRLKQGSREIMLGDHIFTSPADGWLTVIPQLQEPTSFIIKGTPFTIEALLGDTVDAGTYIDGMMLIFRLAPPDYHRYHFPCDGTAQVAQRIAGPLDSVHPAVYRAGFQPLIVNERQLIHMETDQFGSIIIVPVGAMLVGRIIHAYTPGKHHTKGDEMGMFAFGGSTLIVLGKKDMLLCDDVFLADSHAQKESRVRVGQRIGRSPGAL